MNIPWRKPHKKEYGYLKNELAEIFRILKIGVLRYNVKLEPYPYNVK